MPRLRVTSALSLVALVVGVACTQWLCTFTDDWVGPPPQRAASLVSLHGHRVQPRSHAPPRVIGALREAAHGQASAARKDDSLVPLSTPPDPAPYARLRGHLDGYVVLDVRTDGSGQVISSAVAQSSGDAVLDAHALATVQRWRFAVPGGGEGVHGRLPMRFDSGPRPTPP